MIKPKKNQWYMRLLDVFLDWKFKFSFENVNYIFDKPFSKEHSLLVIGNHSTWWDGFIGWQLSRYVFKKNFFLIMLESWLKRFWYFQKVGCFSINPGSKSVVESLECAAELLKNTENMVLFFPQGKLTSLYDTEIKFGSGIERIVKKSPNLHLIFYAAFFDYGQKEKPYLNIYLEEVIPQALGSTSINDAYQHFYDQAKSKQIQNFVS